MGRRLVGGQKTLHFNFTESQFEDQHVHQFLISWDLTQIPLDTNDKWNEDALD